MIPLSQAIKNHSELHPLDAAKAAVQAAPSWTTRALHNLHTAWPHLGQSVRAWPPLAAELEAEGIILPIRKWSQVYRPEVHVSLWRALDLMHKDDWPADRIADLLKARGL